AYRHAPAALVAPFEYTALVWGAILGWILWREQPEPLVWTGAAIIMLSGLYITHREAAAAARAGA
ncbi:MAG: DMT family transporter, partial [Rhodospirillales bacterium]|nr:DMT family transporter [Rhodospirillales bacterium]